jgi:hypothetical protein
LQLAPYLFSRREIVCGDLTLRWRSRSNRRMDYEGFKLAYPLLYARFVTAKKSTWLEAKIKESPFADFIEIEEAA